jgi:hypothetical protein
MSVNRNLRTAFTDFYPIFPQFSISFKSTSFTEMVIVKFKRLLLTCFLGKEKKRDPVKNGLELFIFSSINFLSFYWTFWAVKENFYGISFGLTNERVLVFEH